MKILVIEPDKVLGEALSSSLQHAKHHVTWRRSAQKALDALDDQLPDVILLEIQLGLHNGIEFLYEIRSYPEWQYIPVIIHTGNAKALDRQFSKAFEELGVQTVLYKPRTTSQNLLHAVRNVVSVV